MARTIITSSELDQDGAPVKHSTDYAPCIPILLNQIKERGFQVVSIAETHVGDEERAKFGFGILPEKKGLHEDRLKGFGSMGSIGK